MYYTTQGDGSETCLLQWEGIDCLTFLMDRGNLALLEEGKLTPTLGSLTIGVKWFLTGSNKKE